MGSAKRLQSGLWIALLLGIADGCTKKPLHAPAAAGSRAQSDSDPTPAVTARLDEPCERHWTPVNRSRAFHCVDQWFAQNDVDAALRGYERLLVRRVSDERAAAYDFAEASAMFGRSDAALASVAELDAQRPTRLIVEGVLALHHWMRTGEARHADVVRRSFQMLLARQPQNPYALVLGLRYFLHAAKLEPLMLGLAWQTCQERLSWLERGDQEVVGRAEVLARCAEVALASDRPSESRRLFARALEIDPHQAEGRLRWAGLELDAGNVIVAAELFSAATNAPRSYHRLAAQMGLGVTRARMRDGPGAEKAYREAITAFHQWAAPENGALPKEILYNLGVVLASSADPLLRGEARELLQEFIARPDADEVRALRCRQMLHELKGEFP